MSCSDRKLRVSQCMDELGVVRDGLGVSAWAHGCGRCGEPDGAGESVLLGLARRIEARDPSTAGHCERLSAQAAELGRRLGLDSEEVKALAWAGIVHDIGKVAVPESVLLKAGPLYAEEWEIMRQHPIVGEGICRSVDAFQLVLPLVRHHHERLDGSGYPDGLAGDQIPVGVRIIQITDVYDALASERPYKRALSPRVALERLETEVEMGWWDRNVYAEFRRCVKETEAAA